MSVPYNAGFKAGVDGKPEEERPEYKLMQSEMEWLEGWIKGNSYYKLRQESRTIDCGMPECVDAKVCCFPDMSFCPKNRRAFLRGEV